MAATDVVVRDGSTVCLRQADERDVHGLLQFLQSLSQQSRYYRFLGQVPITESRVRASIGHLGGPARSLVAESGARIVAFASYYCDNPSSNRAEVAFAVSDAVQGHGIGTRLLEQLAKFARDAGIDTFDAYVLGDNARCSMSSATPASRKQ
jgi:N-acetylglutamate synthase-like GNAT family acetyltransferase